MQELTFTDILDYEEDQYLFSHPYTDMLLKYFSEYQPRVVTWNDIGFHHLAEDEVRVLLRKPRKKRSVEIIIVPSSRPGGADFGYEFMGVGNDPLTHRSESTFLSFDQLLKDVEAIFRNEVCAFFVKDYRGNILSSALMPKNDVYLGKRKRLLYQAPDDHRGIAISLCFVRQIQICFWDSCKDRIYHY